MKRVVVTKTGVKEVELTASEVAEKQEMEQAVLAKLAATEYARNRKASYEAEFGQTWEDTLDYIFKNGMDQYNLRKAEIKTQFPKPEGQ